MGRCRAPTFAQGVVAGGGVGPALREHRRLHSHSMGMGRGAHGLAPSGAVTCGHLVSGAG